MENLHNSYLYQFIVSWYWLHLMISPSWPDINECEQEGICSQICNNTIGGFECSCLEGYNLLPDKRTCKAGGPKPTLLFANRIDISKMSTDKSDFKPILKDLKNAIGLGKFLAMYFRLVLFDIITCSQKTKKVFKKL